MTTALPAVAVSAYQHYRAKGVPANPAACIVAVLYAGESALNPGSQGKQSSETGGVLNPLGAYGIASWDGPRQEALQYFASAKGENVADLNTQLDFVLTECANSYSAVWAGIQANMPVAQFGPLFVEKYESPANPAAEWTRSEALATALAALPVTQAPSTSSGQAPSTSSGQAPQPTKLPDVELTALTEIFETLSNFDLAAAERMSYYIYSRFHLPGTP